ncbi:hypothetical protein BDV59DRAFT_180620 [Aspergillus ambiguus]|uniref:uncharacterized protein n=1 Tax=Aspergillus ambiguus TaxID=176160 RepID=UPI003CCD08B9
MCNLTDLPAELIVDVLAKLTNLDSLHSAISTCRRLRDVFAKSQLHVIKLIILRTVRLESDSSTYRLLRLLQFIISHKFIQRDVAMSLFESAWKLFKQKKYTHFFYWQTNYEQILYPFGRALAWSLVLDGCQSDAIKLLQDIINASGNFKTEHVFFDCPPTLRPLRGLLQRLLSEKSRSISTAQYPIRHIVDIPVAKIDRTGIVLEPTDMHVKKIDRMKLTQHGILFRKTSILIQFSPFSHMHAYRSSHPLFLGYSAGIQKDDFSDDVARVLAHRQDDNVI